MNDIYFNYNGALLPAGRPVIGADNRGFRYGDGLFETIRVAGGKIPLLNFHYERLLQGLALMQFEPLTSLTAEYLQKQILELCRKNGHEKSARIRVTVFRGEGGLYDPKDLAPNIIIQSWNLPASPREINSNGLQVAVFEDGRKSCDAFSHLKSSNFLLYAMAALFAKKNSLNDALILNMHARICEATTANIFMIKNQQIFTPSLAEGCIAGVMRRNLIEQLPVRGYKLTEKELTLTDILTADELFLSNAIHGIRWVHTVGDRQYVNRQCEQLYRTMFA